MVPTNSTTQSTRSSLGHRPKDWEGVERPVRRLLRSMQRFSLLLCIFEDSAGLSPRTLKMTVCQLSIDGLTSTMIIGIWACDVAIGSGDG